jgi:DNA modification methylase
MSFIEDNFIDGILTSPPYFDALDYIGNNKISIIILGFQNDLLYGSTKDYYLRFYDYDLNLPESSLNLLKLLRQSKRSTKAQIVENYLNMMKLSFRECYRVLKPEKYYAMVVSKYHSWIINGEEQRIETSKVLADLGISEGFKLTGIIQHGLSKADKGKINVEDILLFKK